MKRKALMRVLIYAGLFGLVMPGLSACGTLAFRPTPTPEILADCFRTYTFSAYVDANGNGTQESGEGPLPGVEFRLNGPFAHSIVGGRAVTDDSGMTRIDSWAPGECLPGMEVYALAPEGYTSVNAFPAALSDDQMAYVFAFLPGG